MRLKKVISGGQIGADQAGLMAAREARLETGGIAPRGYRTLVGPEPSLKTFGLMESASPYYADRTEENVANSDGTIRFATDFSSPGEKCTLKAILKYKKPFFDVDLNDPAPPKDVVEWLIESEIEVLNVAGNGNIDIEQQVKTYLGEVFATLTLMDIFS